MNIIYRPYEAKDYQQVKEYLVDLLRTLAKINPLRLAEPASSYGDGFLQKILGLMEANKAAIMVATADSEIVGCCVGYVKTQSPSDALQYKPLKTGHISDLYVKESYRKMGIGERLMQEIQAYFESINCDLIEIEVLAANAPAHELYVKLGYQDQLIGMIKPLK